MSNDKAKQEAEIWKVKFAYSGTKSREFFDKEFQVGEGENIDQLINKYTANQNAGEPKSDRIRYWSKEKITHLKHMQ